MKFFKKKYNEESPDVILQNKIVKSKSELSLIIEEQVELMTSKYNKHSLLNKIEEKLQLERYLYPDLDAYKYEILKKTVFYKEMIKSLSLLLAESLRQNEASEDQTKLKLIEIKQEIYSQIERLIDKHYEDFFIRYLSTDEGLSGLEREYKEQLLKYEWFKEMITDRRVISLTIPEEVPVRWVVRRIEEVCYQKAGETFYLV